MTKYWSCSNCTEMARTVDDATPMHLCQGMGLLIPLSVDGTTAKIIVVEREDYIGTEIVQYDRMNNRPVMSVITERADGQDCTVYAPLATATIEEARDGLV